MSQPVSTFAYPYGMVDEAARLAVERAGFLAACTVVPGHNPLAIDPLAVRRLEIYGTFSLLRFVLTVRFGDTRLLTAGGHAGPPETWGNMARRRSLKGVIGPADRRDKVRRSV